MGELKARMTDLIDRYEATRLYARHNKPEAWTAYCSAHGFDAAHDAYDMLA